MPMTRGATIRGRDTGPQNAAVETFKGALRGELLRHGDAGYDSTRKIHNGMIDHHPAMIARCRGVADVVNTVKFARAHRLLISVRSGGHGVAGYAICNGGVVIDLSCMKSIRVDPRNQTARAEAGVTWGEFDHETQAFGLATTGGVARPTGIAGLTLGGGLGFLMRSYGLTCDNLISADVVTADGRLLTASATENSDLFWGLRGGGGNFGVVTSFEYRLHPVGQVLAGLLIYPFRHAREVMRMFREFTSTAPDYLGSYCVLGTAPDGAAVAVILLGYYGAIEEGERLHQSLRRPIQPLSDDVKPRSYLELQSIVEHFNPFGLRNYWKSNFLKALSDEAIDALVEHFVHPPSPFAHVVVEALGGAVARISDDETAFSHRSAPYNLNIVGIWADAADDTKATGWVRGLWTAAQPFSSGGVYVNFLGTEDDEGSERLKAAYGAAKCDRLVALKNRYDPENLFRFNHNVRPTADQGKKPDGDRLA